MFKQEHVHTEHRSTWTKTKIICVCLADVPEETY